MKDNRKEFS